MPLLSLFENTKHTKPNHQKQILRKNTSTKDDLAYLYDAMGNRIVKIVKPRNVIVGGSGFTEVSPTADWLYTYYTRDASGNILATYTDIKNNETPNQTEYSIYGSSRLGTQTCTAEELNEYIYTNTIQTKIETINFRQNSVISINGVPFVGGNFSYNFQIDDEIVLNSGETFIIYSNLSTGYIKNVLYITCDIVKTIGTENISSNNTKGRKTYELSNHLGNVMVTVSDKRLGVDDGTGKVDYYLADVVSAQDYYPFGSTMPGRTYTPPSNEKYRFGFNGKEDDKEWGTSNIQDYGFRLYNPALGKFLSVDPLSPKYPWYTPYQFAGNKPIWATDLDGLEENLYVIDVWKNSEGKVQLNIRYVTNMNTENTTVHALYGVSIDPSQGGTLIVINDLDNMTTQFITEAPKEKNFIRKLIDGFSSWGSENEVPGGIRFTTSNPFFGDYNDEEKKSTGTVESINIDDLLDVIIGKAPSGKGKMMEQMGKLDNEYVQAWKLITETMEKVFEGAGHIKDGAVAFKDVVDEKKNNFETEQDSILVPDGGSRNTGNPYINYPTYKKIANPNKVE